MVPFYAGRCTESARSIKVLKIPRALRAVSRSICVNLGLHGCMGPLISLRFHESVMRFHLLPLAAVTVVAAVLTGCTAAEKKLGRGINNFTEPVRMGEIQRSYEQALILDGPGAGTAGLVRGVNRTIGRAVTGAFEIITFPIPSDPYVKPNGYVHPDAYTPRRHSSTIMAQDSKMGFDSSGDVLPFAPGSRFSIFE